MTDARSTTEWPRGTVTFLFTDLEGSTGLWQRHARVMPAAYARHDALLRGAVAAHGGTVYKVVGDAFQVAFPSVPAAILAAIEAQRAFAAEPWGETGPLKVRMALHTCAAAPDATSDYRSPCLNRLGRLLAAAHGGQILLSAAARELAEEGLPAGGGLRDLGAWRLRDLPRPERIFQLVAPGLPDDFPPPAALPAAGSDRQDGGAGSRPAAGRTLRRRWTVVDGIAVVILGALVVATSYWAGARTGADEDDATPAPAAAAGSTATLHPAVVDVMTEVARRPEAFEDVIQMSRFTDAQLGSASGPIFRVTVPASDLPSLIAFGEVNFGPGPGAAATALPGPVVLWVTLGPGFRLYATEPITVHQSLATNAPGGTYETKYAEVQPGDVVVVPAGIPFSGEAVEPEIPGIANAIAFFPSGELSTLPGSWSARWTSYAALTGLPSGLLTVSIESVVLDPGADQAITAEANPMLLAFPYGMHQSPSVDPISVVVDGPAAFTPRREWQIGMVDPGILATPAIWINQDGRETSLELPTAKPAATPVPLGQRIELGNAPMPFDAGLALQPGTTARFLSPDDDAQPVWIVALTVSSGGLQGEGTPAP